MVKVKGRSKRKHRERLQSAFEATARAYDNQMHRVISEERDWGPGFGTTYRKNGEIVQGGNRNIVDQGNLALSQSVVIRDGKATYAWHGNGETPATKVHEGAFLRSGREIPGRPWTERARQEIDLAQTFVERYHSARD